MRVRKNLRQLVTSMLAISLAVSNTVYASDTLMISQEQLGLMFDGVESIVVQLEELGLSKQDISELFQISPREDSFYQQTPTEEIPYTGSFAAEVSTSDYDGNAPDSDTVQKERIKNIYGVALQYYDTKYYQGSKSSGQDFGNYLTYLYLSHYIDAPRRAPTANDLPYIITRDDVYAYDQFLRNANSSNLMNGFADLGAALYSSFDFFSSLTAISTVDGTIRKGALDAKSAVDNMEDTASAIETIVSLVTDNLVMKYGTAVNSKELTDDTLEYVESKLSALDFYKDYQKNLLDKVTGIMTSTLIGVVSSSIPLIGTIVSLVPLFVYEYTGLIQLAVLVSLHYTFSLRYAYRFAISIGVL